MLYKFKGHAPQAMHQPWNGWVAENATVIGQVELGQQVSIWFGAVVRADNCKIRLGDFTNIQENAVLHTDAGIEMNIGNYVTIGHQAMLHGCTVGDNSLIGINAVKTLDETAEARLKMSALHYAEHFKQFIDLEPAQL